MDDIVEFMLRNRRFVRYDSGAVMYDMCQKSFEKLAKDAKAKFKYGKTVLVDTRIIDRFLETCRVVED